ncbi:MAG: sugar nucleotide epimerase [Myxococcaceae bacterium]|nr:sugar nucleotide epimerase [Myxococcaceae bacterium]
MHDGKYQKTATTRLTQPDEESGYVLITGGSGFIGANLAQRLLAQGRRVVLYDNLSRAGVETNARWLAREYGERVRLVRGDVRDAAKVQQLVASASAVFHFAAQVAVTTSLIEPLEDFDINARGTLNVLEAVRRLERPVPLLFTSTNKVYGGLEDVQLTEGDQQYQPADASLRAHGVSEQRALDFHSPYGCSKGAADQYVIDYARSYGLRAVVFRMSCIYGPRQFGTEDQGWVAHFLIRAAQQRPISIYGDGKQVRDILFVSDLIDAMLLAEDQSEALAGQAFNMGGGPDNVISLLELIERITALGGGQRPTLHFDAPRVGDQRYYVSDTRKFQAATGWHPRVSVAQGLKALSHWLGEQRAVEPETSSLQLGAAS